MLLSTLIASLALAADPVVAIGDGLVVAPSQVQTADASTGSWVAALADCLEEAESGRFRVVDRVQSGETARSARDRVSDLRDLKPSVVLVGLGARELGATRPDANRFRKDLMRLLRDLRGFDEPAEVVLVGMVAPTLHQADVGGDPEQSVMDDLADTWNATLGDFAKGEGIRVVDLWKSWPRDGEDRAALTTGAWELSDQGHVRVAAAVCEVLLAAPAGPAAAAGAIAADDVAVDEEASEASAAEPEPGDASGGRTPQPR